MEGYRLGSMWIGILLGKGWNSIAVSGLCLIDRLGLISVVTGFRVRLVLMNSLLIMDTAVMMSIMNVEVNDYYILIFTNS